MTIQPTQYKAVMDGCEESGLMEAKVVELDVLVC